MQNGGRITLDKVGVLRRRGWEVFLGVAPLFYHFNIYAAVRTPAEIAAGCARGGLLTYYVVYSPVGVVIYGVVDPSDIPGEPWGDFKKVPRNFGCAVISAVRRGGLEAVRDLYAAVAYLEKPPLGALDLFLMEALGVCQNPPQPLAPYCKALEAYEKRRRGVSQKTGGAAAGETERAEEERGGDCLSFFARYSHCLRLFRERLCG